MITTDGITNKQINVTNVLALGDICTAAQGGLKVKRLVDGGDILEGTARHIVKSEDDYSFAHDQDLRMSYLRVTLSNGLDTAWLIDDLITDWHKGFFVLDRD